MSKKKKLLNFMNVVDIFLKIFDVNEYVDEIFMIYLLFWIIYDEHQMF